MRGNRTDANHLRLIRSLRDFGATVQSLTMVKFGAPDLLIGWRKTNFLVEIKDGDKPPSRRKLTPAEQMWHDSWKGQIAICKNFDEILKLLKEGK